MTTAARVMRCDVKLDLASAPIGVGFLTREEPAFSRLTDDGRSLSTMHIGSDIELVSTLPMDRDLPRHLDADDFACLSKRVVRKLDLLLLPFLCLLFLLNSLDKSNVGNAESGHFTEDLGLPKSALNVSVAWFFAVFVSCQPIGAFFGRKYGMARYVPAVMSLWGVCTALHIAVQSQTQLVTLRVFIAALESGFYPTTVSCKSDYRDC